VVPNIISRIIEIHSIFLVDAIMENILSYLACFATRSAEQEELLSMVGCDIPYEKKEKFGLERKVEVSWGSPASPVFLSRQEYSNQTFLNV